MLLLNHSSFALETGTDEAGRGCLAGPVTAAAVILPEDFQNELLNDSKQLSEKSRFHLKPIIETQALTFAVTHLEPAIIDEINILNASIKAMQESILKLNPTPHYIIVDGNRFKPVADIPHSCIIKGDLKYGAKRSNPDGSIYLHSRELEFEHPTSKENIKITAPVPNDKLWLWFESEIRKK